MTQGPKIEQISLRRRVDNFGATRRDENVVSAAGYVFTVPIEEIG